MIDKVKELKEKGVLKITLSTIIIRVTFEDNNRLIEKRGKDLGVVINDVYKEVFN